MQNNNEKIPDEIVGAAEQGCVEEFSYKPKRLYSFIKRILDFGSAFGALIIFAIPMIIIAIIIKCESKGPVLFAGQRMGRNNKPFKFYKFRSMRVDAPSSEATRNIDGAKYITKVGKVLRRTSLDELPQLFNILKGNMSLVGPRPVVVTETDLIANRTKYNVHLIRGGLTGYTQLQGRDEITDMDEKARLDAYYMVNRSLWMDTKVFFKTILSILKSDGVVEGNGKTNASAEMMTLEKSDKEQRDKCSDDGGASNCELGENSARNSYDNKSDDNDIKDAVVDSPNSGEEDKPE